MPLPPLSPPLQPDRRRCCSYRRPCRSWRRCLSLSLLAAAVITVTAWLTSPVLAWSSFRRSSKPSASLASLLLAFGSRGGDSGGRWEPDLGPVWWAARGDMAGFAAWGRRYSMEDRFSIGTRVFALPGDDYGDAKGGHDDDGGGADNGTTRIYGLFDGHGGQNAVDFVSRTLPAKVLESLAGMSRGEMDAATLREILSREIQATDDALLRHIDSVGGEDSGSTCVLAVVNGDSLTVASVGDSRAVLCDAGGRAVPLTKDHKPYLPAERRRIQRAGGFIRLSSVWRVQGELAMSRALGDSRLKRLGVISAQPDVATVPLTGRRALLIVASDGLWDVVGNQEAVDVARRHAARPLDGARALALEALRRGSGDNVTVVVVVLLARGG